MRKENETEGVFIVYEYNNNEYERKENGAYRLIYIYYKDKSYNWTVENNTTCMYLL